MNRDIFFSIKGNLLFLLLLPSVIMFESSCKKFVEVDPPKTQLVNTAVFNNDAGALAAESAIYAKMASQSGSWTLSVYPSFSSDEEINYSTDNRYIQIYSNAITPDNSFVSDIWTNAYNFIYQANAVLEGIDGSTGMTNAVKQQLTGEAKFVRSFWYFYLVNLFDDVPLTTTTSYQSNAIASRTSKSIIYQQIINDLQDAIVNLNSNFVEADGITTKSTTERLRPTKSAASALLARIYLYTQDWADAATQASAVISKNSMFFLLSDLNQVFLKNSKEAIWQCSAGPAFNTWEGYFLNLSTSLPPQYAPGALSSQMLNAFDSTDIRRKKWVASTVSGANVYYYPNKYKVDYSTRVTEYETVLRLAEQYLIRAEAEANGANGGITAAINDINVIRNRAGLSNYAGATDKTSVLNAILHERQVELFTEFAHRWLDLKRTGNIDAVMNTVAPYKGSSWGTNKQLYPIPSSEIQTDNKLTQNTGY